MLQQKIVNEYMTRSVVTLNPDNTMFEASELLQKNRISVAPVIDANRNLLGILSEWDCLNISLKGRMEKFPSGKVTEYMSKDVLAVTPDTGVFEVIQIFIEKRYHRIPVSKNGKLVGIISRQDLMAAILDIG